ncbi:DHA1 family bicyclomycin/chloramphenicol resistance-like MFS transporter [Dysgonomonas sp. PH5-45]|uniref:multidrug effflux MFS transporter n=1 Tax=unclassified Dysgonomonas TaxID=2630389 RepID=UPI002474D84D|nr:MULTISPECIES: multidrug effflux MFS transporter [unclassified Dysgonomonas]MDH6354969.1 DHA1 family bicyclomycin/chloramphenicol resistance-like MFS transporter [Dysgonomonas sp. PH5-45]MDH6387907.1 DHA1 family bicyclomycin/chloramphenicol resistance-like MFS transporter [Dysgonomonas sp. PH5-37]
MKNLSIMQWVVIIILALLTALEPLSIDLYLPGFIPMSNTFGVPLSTVQISLSTFLAGFAIGQLLWGPLADRFGRKKPILASLFIFIIASVACIYVRDIHQLWVVRFVQAIGGCGGVVISRAVVTDYFDKTKTLKIYSLLAVIMGVAPIIAPSIGNAVLSFFNWQALFGTLAALGAVIFIFTLFFLPETGGGSLRVEQKNVFRSYLEVLKVKKFVVYSIVGGIANGALMLYVSNGPFIIMEEGGFDRNAFSVIFSVNALGLMVSSYLTGVLQKYMSTPKLVKYSLVFMFAVSVFLLSFMYLKVSVYPVLVLLFLYVFPIGVLFSASTELAITPFSGSSSGTASALFGSIQLGVSFVCTLLFGFVNNGTMTVVGLAFFLCSLTGLFTVYGRFSYKEESECPAM